MSSDARYVAFVSESTNLVPGDINGSPDVFVRDRLLATTIQVDVSSTGTPADISDEADAMVSKDGRYVAFQTLADNLVPGDTNGVSDIFVRDLVAGTTERVSVGPGGVQAGWESRGVWISADARYVGFNTAAPNLVTGDTNGTWDTFLRDRLLGVTERVSLSSNGSQGNAYSTTDRVHGSDDGRFIVFASRASNLVPADTNGREDVFVRDRLGGPDFKTLCDPGAGGVISCPCSNPPSGPGRGCENSAATGGAMLAGSGSTSLSSDSLAFTTTWEKSTAASILLQGTSALAGGVVYGQGVRCVGGSLKRLYTKSAVAGSITAPDFASGDQQVSVRSEARGDPILLGQSRWYLVFYRDPVVLGGCPASSSFNATQTGRIDWSL
jgi:hypothetical protein